uniref:caveolae-associated protein 1-like n=1 Tax=Myxine glutinosa TaxID=7769 RepID=UPI0035902016
MEEPTMHQDSLLFKKQPDMNSLVITEEPTFLEQAADIPKTQEPAVIVAETPEELNPTPSPKDDKLQDEAGHSFGKGDLESAAEASTSSKAEETLIKDSPQVNAVSVLTLLDKLMGMVEDVQSAQRNIEQRQTDIEGSVHHIEGNLSQMNKTQGETSHSVHLALDKTRKVSANVKDVRQRLEKQTGEIRKLEANHGELLKRNNFRIMVYQDGSNVPLSTASTRTRLKSSEGALAGEEGKLEGEIQQGFEGDELHLSSDEDIDMIDEPETRAERLKKSGQRQVETIKKAFSRRNLEKKVNKIVSPETRDKIRHSMAPHRSKMASEGSDALAEGEVPVNEEAINAAEQVQVTSAEVVATESPKPGTKRMDNMKKALSRQTFEKKVTRLSQRIVPQEKRDKIRKSFAPEHKKEGRDNVTSFNVPPFKFTVKKVRAGDVVETEEYEINPEQMEFANGDKNPSIVQTEMAALAASIVAIDKKEPGDESASVAVSVQPSENEDQPAVLVVQQNA